MTTTTARAPHERLAADTRMGVVDLMVSDMDAVSRFYTEGVGLVPLAEGSNTLTLGLGTTPVVTLTHSPSLRLPSRNDAGLFHTAVLFADASQLARSLYSTLRRYGPLYQGSGDHLVSRAFYFSDPEGNGVELYVDRPRSEWTWTDGNVAMATLALDTMGFLQDNLGEEFVETDGSPVDLSGELGHVHLQVGDVAAARSFYVDALGFDETAALGGQALFVSAGGYHHHMAMNTWNSRGAGMRGPTLGLGRVDILVPTQDEIDMVTARLAARGIRGDSDGRTLSVRDPWANLITLSVG